MKYIFGRSIDEFINLKTLSIKEIKYKLLSKGLKCTLIADYIQDNKEEMEEYEIRCAKKIVSKKKKDMDENEIKYFLKKKGYRDESIYIALSEG